LYVDKAGTYTFTFTLYDGDGVALASDTATVRAYPAEEDYRVYIDAGKHGTVTVSDRYAAKGDRVIIYATPDKGYELDTLKVYDAWGDRVDVYAYGSNYAFTMPRSAVKVVATFTDVKYGHFTDVPTDSWYYDAVYYVYNHDIMDGIGNRTFNPYGDLSRAMIVTTLYRLEGEPGVRTSGSFRDVPDNTWYSSAVEWAAKEGIVKGYGKKTFKPSESVTVEQLAAILQRYADYKGYDIDETVRLYADAVVSQWAVNNVRWAAAEGLLRDGRSTNGTLVATRAEIAYALYGFMVNVAK
ncbi:MAG TPA: S-layer homology domain-containing protein, partial [Candidatus Avoscillospira stercoripullorum]|nr:S-layer homology domain-containing protein [Candidatus Avoscillospira stercoripullorum]